MDKKSKKEGKVTKERIKSKKRKLVDKEASVYSSHVASENELIHDKRSKREGKIAKERSKLKKKKLVDKEALVQSSPSASRNELTYGDTVVAKESNQSEIQTRTGDTSKPQEANGIDNRTKKSKKARKKQNDHSVSKIDSKSKERSETAERAIYHISSGEDCSKGMKKWITEFHQSRPGLKILQERIDDYMTAHEEQEEQARKERKASVAEGGWTVVEHHKGRKKTTDVESGITVGSVAQAAVVDKMTKKKSKEVGLDFYRFQKREANRNEIMTLQSKFEQDKKRIQQLRAARKFRPY